MDGDRVRWFIVVVVVVFSSCDGGGGCWQVRRGRASLCFPSINNKFGGLIIPVVVECESEGRSLVCTSGWLLPTVVLISSRCGYVVASTTALASASIVSNEYASGKGVSIKGMTEDNRPRCKLLSSPSSKDVSLLSKLMFGILCKIDSYEAYDISMLSSSS